MKKQVFGKGCMYANHMNPAVEYVPGRVHPKIKKTKSRENIKKNYYKKTSRKSDAKMMEKSSKNGPKMDAKSIKFTFNG